MSGRFAPGAIRAPASLAEALRIIADVPAARVIAGGTALQLDWAKGDAPPPVLIDIGRLAELREIAISGGRAGGRGVPGAGLGEPDGSDPVAAPGRAAAPALAGIRIGAGIRLAALERHAGIAAALPLLTAAIGTVAGPSVRSLATLGGNIAGRTGCLLPALLALDASLEGIRPEGPWREPLALWLQRPARPDELIAAIHVPVMPGSWPGPAGIGASQGMASPEEISSEGTSRSLWADAASSPAPAGEPASLGRVGAIASPDRAQVAVSLEPEEPAAAIVPDGLRWVWRKVGLRAAFTPAVITVAGWLTVVDGVVSACRIAVGGGIVRPQLLAGAAARLTGQPFAGIDWDDLKGALLAEIDAPDDAVRSGRYRRLVATAALIHGLGGPLRAIRPGRASAAPPPAVSAFAAPAPTPPAPTPADPARSGPAASPAETGPPGRPPAGTIVVSHAAEPARWAIRPDGPPKIAGTFAYLTDHRAPDMLVGRILRAGRPHARIRAIDTRRAEALPGVIAVVTHRDVPGLNAYGIVTPDQPAFCHDKVRHAGDAVAAVAARDAATAEAALRLITVDYEDLPLVDTPEAALAPGAPEVHAGGNLFRRLDFARGDVDAALAGAVHVIEATYVTPRQMHGFLETEGGWAVVAPDGSLAIHAGGQHGARDRMQLARILALPEARIRVVTSPTGGAFGGKDELTVQPALALLALKSGRPVRLQLSRAESVLAGLKRNPMTIRMRTGCDAEGRLVAQEVDLLADGGAYASLGGAVLETALEHAAGPYVIPHVRTRGRLAATNNGLCGAFRGFGANQMAFAVECQMDRLAAVLGLSPLEIRRRNLKPAGTSGYLGQTVAPSERLAEMLAAAAADPLWHAPTGLSADGAESIGVGMAMNYHGNGLGSVIPDPAGGGLRLAADGRIEAVFGLDEMGQGLIAAIVGTVSQQLGCGRDDIRAVTGDTGEGPDSGSTTASRGTYVIWETARRAGPAFAGAVLRAAAGVLGRNDESLKLAPGGIADRLSNSGELLLGFADLAKVLDEESLPSTMVEFDYPKTDFDAGNARFLFVFGACVARVAVSRITGQVRVLDLHQHTAAGPVVDLAAYLGQQEGGAVQGLGFTLSEDAIMRDGAFVTANLDTYMLPGMADAPDRMTVAALEHLDAGDPFGPRGAGELGIGAVTPAIVNAVAAATGAFVGVTPIPPEALLDAMAAGA